MKKIIIIMMAILLTPFSAFAASTNERLEQLEKEVQALKAEKETGSVVKSKFPVTLYGFIAGQMYGSDSQTLLYTTGAGSVVAQSSVANERVVTKDDGWIGLTPQNSRVGLDWTGSKVSPKLTLGGKLEMDFLNPGGGASPRPRIRLFFLNLSGKNWVLEAGQDWDLFSPLNTKSLSLGGNIWFQGNLGFRRPQIRFTYNLPFFAEINNLKFALSANNPSNLDTIINNGNSTGVPYGELLVQYNRRMTNGDFVAALSSTMGTHRNAGTDDLMWGFAGSLNIPLHRLFKLSGEVQIGRELGNFQAYAGTVGHVFSTDAWAQVSSKWNKFFETNGGYGVSYLQNSKVAALAIQKNQNIFANIKFYPVESFYIGLEYNNMRSKYKTSGTSTANLLITNLVWTY